MKNLNDIPSVKTIYVWNIAGNIANALLSVVTLMIVTRFLDSAEADVFSIGWAISQLLATIGTYQIRMYQATDIVGKFKFRQYLIYRFITIGIMLLSSGVYVYVRGYSGEKLLVVLLMCVFRAIDSFADVYEGWFQQKERYDLAGKALAYRVGISIVTFGVSLFVSNNLFLACEILVFTYIICLFCFNVRYYRVVKVFKEQQSKESLGIRWILKITTEGFPLFFNAFLMMAIMNAPKMVLDVYIENGSLIQGVQTIFNIIFMPASFLNLAYLVFRPLITKMAIVWNNGERKEFIQILFKIIIALMGISVILILGSAFLGIPILTFVYAVDLSNYKRELLIIILGGCLYTFSAVLDNALVIIRKQYALIFAYVVTFIYIHFASKIMVGLWGVAGAALAYTTAMCVFLIVIILAFGVCFINKK